MKKVLLIVAAILLANAVSAQNYEGTFIKYYKISQLIHTQIIAN